MNETEKTNNYDAEMMAFMESSMNAMLTVDELGVLVGITPGVEVLFGFGKDELIGKHIKTLIPEAFDKLLVAEPRDDARANSGNQFDGACSAVGVCKDGSTFPLIYSFVEISFEAKQLFVALVRDASDWNERQARLEAILDNAVDAIITIDERGLIDSANPATTRLFGYEIQEVIGQNVKMLMPNPFREEHDTYLRNYMDSGIRKIIGIGREVVGQRKDGSSFPMHLAVSEVRFGDRRMFTGIVRDISDLKAVERELEEVNEQLEDRVKLRTAELQEAQADLVRSEKFATLGKVSGGIAHEIRNPLNAVKTSAYFLLNAQQLSEEKTREHLERIDRQVSMIDNVVTALSDVAKLPDARLVSTDLRPVLREVVESISLPPNINHSLDLDNELPQVRVDKNQIVIAFKNLIRNARDAMPDGGELAISSTVGNASVAFHVADNGIGISPDYLELILEPLFTTKARGMGLGLSITRAIVEKNQGSLSVESRIGEGSRFTIELKRA